MKSINYNQIASTYAQRRQARQFVVDELKKGCPATNGRILETGCGTGNYLRALTISGYEGYGIDPSSAMLHKANRTNKTTYISGMAESLPFEDKTFDFAFSIDVIHHVSSIKSYFYEALRVLKPDGMICCVTDSEEIITNRKPLAEYWPGTVVVDLKRYHPIRSLRERMKAAGFTGITEHEIKESYFIDDLTPFRDKAYSCLQLIPEEEFQQGLHRLESNMRKGPVTGFAMYLCLWGRKLSESMPREL
jgi:ubiquinone/menaquinone biosynthesis C-methylase UbiE